MIENKVNFTVGIRGTSIRFPCKCGNSFGRGEARNFCPECGAKLSTLQQVGTFEVRGFVLMQLVMKQVWDILLQAEDEQEAAEMLERWLGPPTAGGEE